MDKCYKCDKEMGREDNGSTLTGVKVTVDVASKTEETITYNNLQLGKYSDGKGGCSVSMCYECYIDGLFRAPLDTVLPRNIL